MKITKSDNIKSEYCCTVVQIGEVKPIEGKDLIGQTLVNGLSIVVRKDQVKEGDILIYAANETQLHEEFLRVNNLFEDKTMNSDPEKKGYFNKYGRVRMIRLGGVPSMGYLFGFDELLNWCPDLQPKDFPQIGEDFDTINGELFVKAYIPPVKEGTPRKSSTEKRNKKLAQYDRIIPGEFNFHYTTNQLNREIHRIKPEDVVCISNKLHGSSDIIGNILTNVPKWNGLYSRIFNYLPKFLQFTKQDYDVIYSSRTVIKNKYYNSKVTPGFYNTDIWGGYYELLKDKIPQGMTLYGEIFGYVDGSESMIQKGYDYGCAPGENKLMIYRINSTLSNGTHFEWDVQEVYDWTVKFMEDNPEIAHKLHPIDIFYHGTLKDLYPEIPIDQHWHENVLEALKKEKRFGMEMNEPMCKNKVPREGIVLRIDGDIINEAWKLKCVKFLAKEAVSMDNGEVDIEMIQTEY